MTTAGATAVFATWAKGYSYRGTGPSELYIQMDGVTSQEQADSLCDAVLDVQKSTLLTHTHQGPMEAGTALPLVGARMAGSPIVGYTAAMDGEVTLLTPELADPLARKGDALRRRIERASSGVQSLWGSPGRGDTDRSSGTDTTPPPFTVPGKLTDLLEEDDNGDTPDRNSVPWPTKTGWKGSWLNCLLDTPGTSTTRVDAFQMSGVQDEDFTLTRISTCYIGAGKRRAISRIGGNGLLPGEALMMRVVSVGLDAARLTVTPHGAPA